MKEKLKVFFDLDETLIHTEFKSYDPRCKVISLSDGDYFFRIKPDAIDAINVACELVGRENVYILTVATRDYAKAILKISEFGIPFDRLFAREDLADCCVNTSFGASTTLPHVDFEKTRNILIDNLPAIGNFHKVAFLNMDTDDYMNVRDYFGVDFPGDEFASNVSDFISERL